MNQFINSYIDSLTTFQKAHVATILEEAKVGKEQLDSISDKLLGLGDFYPLTLDNEIPGTFINARSMRIKFSDVMQKMSFLYQISSLVSLLLDSHASTLSSDIQAIEDDLLTLEKMANNYSFLLADGGTYDYAYLEPFSDERGRNSFTFQIPDRANQVFTDSQQAVIQTAQGALSLAQDIVVGQGMTVSVTNGNAVAYTIRDTGVSNCVNTTTTTGWQLDIASVNPITSSLPEANGSIGAQVVLEFVLNQVAPAAQIKIVPLSDQVMEILQIIIYDNEQDNIGVSLLAGVELLDRPRMFHFPLQSVQRFKVILNQPSYSRVAQANNGGEKQYNDMHQIISSRVQLDPKHIWESRQDKNYLNALKDIRIYRDNINYGVAQAPVAVPYESYNPQYGPLNLEESLRNINNRGVYYVWNQYDEIEQKLLSIFTERFPDWKLLFSLLGRDPASVNRNISTTRFVPIITAPDIGYKYEYRIGIQNVSIGIDAPGFKGVYVSKPVPSPGDIGVVRLKVSDHNYELPVTDRNSPWMTSTEYSVTNASQPQNEIDWIPILPVGQTQVIAERFFPNEAGTGYLRFQADPQSGIVLYNNGYVVSGPQLIKDPKTNNITGITIRPGLVSASNIFTCDYLPVGDQTTIDFSALGFDRKPLVSSYDQNGSGETYVSTGDRNTVTLGSIPYIDTIQVQNSIYYPTIGMTPYQPITIKFADGSFATNLTDYRGLNQVTLPVSPYYYYIQSGNTLIFNQPVTQGFKVYYQYLQNDVRVRVILRVNDNNFVSPSVSYFHLKAKVRK